MDGVSIDGLMGVFSWFAQTVFTNTEPFGEFKKRTKSSGWGMGFGGRGLVVCAQTTVEVYCSQDPLFYLRPSKLPEAKTT